MRTPPRRRSITGELVGRWAIAVALVPVALIVLAFSGGHVTGPLLITLIVIMVIIAIARAGSRRR